MSVPGIPRIMSCYSLRGEQGVGYNICLYLVFPVMSLYLSKGEVRGGFNICPCLAFLVTSFYLSRKLNRGHMSVPGFPCVMSCLPTYEKEESAESGVVLTYACTMHSPCHVLLHVAK